MSRVGNPDYLTEEYQDRAPEFQELQNPAGELYLRFYVASGREFAISAAGIREVISPSPERITPVPNTSPILLGILNFRGQPVWVADLGHFLDNSAPLSTDRSEIPVIVIEDHEAMVGLAVDRVVGTNWLELDKAQMVSTVQDNIAPFLKGEWSVDEESSRTLGLLDQVTILRSARWAT